jgi:hypothetical protein
VPHVHPRYRHTYSSRGFVLQSVEQSQELAVEADLFPTLEDHIAVVNENHVGGVLLCSLEDLVDPRVGVGGTGDVDSVDEEESTPEPVRKRSSDRSLAGTCKSCKEYPALRPFRQPLGQFIVFPRKDDINLQALGNVIYGLRSWRSTSSASPSSTLLAMR